MAGILPPLFWRGVGTWRRSLIGLESCVAQLQLGVVRFQPAVSGFQIQDVGDAGIVEFMPRMEGTILHAIIAPAKKQEQAKPKLVAPQPQAQAAAPKPAPVPVPQA